MSQLASQLNRAFAHISECKALVKQIYKTHSKKPLGPSAALRLGRIDTALSEVDGELRQINVDNVLALRKAKRPTQAVLEVYVASARRQFEGPYGVFDSIEDLFENYSAELVAESTNALDKIRWRSKKTVRLLYLIIRPTIALLLSWPVALGIVIVGVCVATGFFIHYFIQHPTPGLTPTQAAVNQIQGGLNNVKTVATASNASLWDRLLNSVKELGSILPPVTKGVVALTALVTALQRLLNASIGKANRQH